MGILALPTARYVGLGQCLSLFQFLKQGNTVPTPYHRADVSTK